MLHYNLKSNTGQKFLFFTIIFIYLPDQQESIRSVMLREIVKGAPRLASRVVKIVWVKIFCLSFDFYLKSYKNLELLFETTKQRKMLFSIFTKNTTE